MIELAWLWLRHQPQSVLANWFRVKVGTNRGRIRRIAVLSLWRVSYSLPYGDTSPPAPSHPAL